MALCIGSCVVFIYSHSQIKIMDAEFMKETQIDVENVQKDNEYLTGLLEKYEKKTVKKSKEDK